MNEEHIESVESVRRSAHLELRQARISIAERVSTQLRGTPTHYDLDHIGHLQRIPATITGVIWGWDGNLEALLEYTHPVTGKTETARQII